MTEQCGASPSTATWIEGGGSDDEAPGVAQLAEEGCSTGAKRQKTETGFLVPDVLLILYFRLEAFFCSLLLRRAFL